MIKEKETGYLLRLLKALLDGSESPAVKEALDWKYIWNMCRYHQIGNLAAYGICGKKLEKQIPEQAVEAFSKEQKKGLLREAIQHTEYEMLLKRMEEERLDILPLKGSILKWFYPSPDMRFLTDFDILFREEDSVQVHEVMHSLGYQLKACGFHHDVFVKEPGMVVEMHKFCHCDHAGLDEYMAHVWERCFLKEGFRHVYEMPWEDFYVYMAGHAVKHFRGGGIGIRVLLDFYVFEQKLVEKCDEEKLSELLRQFGLWQFAQEMNRTAEAMLAGSFPAERRELIESILQSGVHGNLKQQTAFGIQQEKYGKAGFLFHRIFLPREWMEYGYPWLKKHPGMLWAAWIVRLVKKGITVPDKGWNQMRELVRVKEEDLLKKTVEQLGIQENKNNE